ncbi:PPOX class F420-dependent oxidoreductase [Novosphingobium aquae]|jgi:PPOX class probable F420-dependent enzyme|uniref:PPOX class F420-dependent oxidoreductase n=1 Tax=Novosphingobium aquae TaxID=3133435 RepID=A0ABU8SBQ7_9SPHN
MAKSRDAVRMNDAEVSAFLAEAHSLQVATLGKDGAPHLTTVWFAVHDGAILFETYGKSQKVVNLQRDPRIAVLAEDGRTYDQLRGVSINGTAEVIEDNPERTALMRVLVDHHFPGQTAKSLDEMAARMAEKRVVIRVKPDKIMSWDHRKLGGKGP